MAATSSFSFLLLLIMAAVPGKMAAVELAESGGGLSAPGGSLSLLCKASGEAAAILWVRQRPGKGLEWVGGFGKMAATAPALRPRVAIFREGSRGAARMRLDDLRAEDTATYYCAKDGGHGGEGPAGRPGKKGK